MQIGFTQGVVFVAAYAERNRIYRGLAEVLLDEAGITLKDLKTCDILPLDADVVRPILRATQKKRKSQSAKKR